MFILFTKLFIKECEVKLGSFIYMKIVIIPTTRTLTVGRGLRILTI